MEALFEELRAREEPVELILAGDFFDFLTIGEVPEGSNRASLTMSRPEYERLFASLKRFKETEGKRVIYLPGNHDAEGWWNPEIQETLREQGLVDEFPYYYAASMPVGDGQRTIYCEHGNQDPANEVEDYNDRLDTPLGYHVVADFIRRVAPFGVISGGLDLSELNKVYPLAAIPRWVTSRYFYDFIGKAVAYLLLPLLGADAVHEVIASPSCAQPRREEPSRRTDGDNRQRPRVRTLLIDFAALSLSTLAVFAIFFLVIRRVVHRALATMSPDGEASDLPDGPQEKIKELLGGDTGPPMDPSIDPKAIDVFISGHTHAPSLSEMARQDGRSAVVVNSGCSCGKCSPSNRASRDHPSSSPSSS